MKRFLKEPLVHFLFLGAMLFAAHGLISREEATEPAKITITQGRIESLAGVFERTWQRPPSAEELQGLVNNYVREEVLYREGLALGLDRDDQIVRRRVGQKLEFINDNAAVAEPSEQELQDYFDANRNKFEPEPRFTFRHIYLDPRRHQMSDAEQVLKQLKDPANAVDPETLGDATMLPLNFQDASVSEVKSVLGDQMVATISKLPVGQWTGPLTSSYGIHIVYLIERGQPAAPMFAEMRQAVRREWERDRRLKASEAAYAELLRRYTVTVEPSQFAMEIPGTTLRSRP